MASSIGKTHCTICNKEKVTYKCVGCSEEFCYKHLGDHQQELSKQFDEIELNRDIFRQSLTDNVQQLNAHRLFQEINQWEQNSIEIIRQTAEETRELLIESLNEYFHEMEKKLNKLTDQLRHMRQENDFNEIHIHKCQTELNRLTKGLTESSKIALQQEESNSLISRISIHVPESSVLDSDVCNSLWAQDGVTIAGGKGVGNDLNQLFRPVGICMDSEQTIYIADTENYRIMEWKYGATKGKIVAGGHGPGTKMNQLNRAVDVVIDKEGKNLIICDQGNRRVVRWSRQNGTSGHTIISDIDCSRLTMDNNGYLYISDREKHEVRRWKMNDTNGILVAGGNGKGDKLNQLDNPTFVAIDDDNSVYVSDWNNHRIMKWVQGAKEGIVVAGGQGKGNSLTQLSNPQGIVVDQSGSIYIADYTNHRVMQWPKDTTEGFVIIGGNEQGEESNQLNRPMGLLLDDEGHLYVIDQWNARVQIFHFNQK
ncbi:unnamed protein product [Adineta steineri]|uniref:Uncharacterized protein n=1 Tax=Adineta steineri TaxID=433720 RepID=A0A818WL28_9BILA|nr:unnamed protein product [Adineta steineri]CAF3727143.1 unnamed protein product [Adineta steineri]